MATIPENGLALILLRVPAKDLLKTCTQVSPKWNKLLSQSFFWRDKMDYDGHGLDWTKLVGISPDSFKRIAIKHCFDRNFIKDKWNLELRNVQSLTLDSRWDADRIVWHGEEIFDGLNFARIEIPPVFINGQPQMPPGFEPIPACIAIHQNDMGFQKRIIIKLADEGLTLQEHIARCTLNKPYKCEIDFCGQCFATEKGKNAHKGKAHTAEERGTLYKCKYCLHGSDSQTAMQKHELQHEEEGGLGFRSRSRSRGPARPSVSNSTNSAATPTRRSSSRARSYNSTPRQRAPSRNIQERAPSRNSSAPRQRASSRNFRETSTTSNSTNSTTMNWASMPPTTNNLRGIDTENRHGAGSAQGILPIRRVANGLLEIAVLNPDYAERKIAEYKRQFAATVNQLSAMNQRLREYCIAEGIQLTTEDFVEEKIQALKAKYPQIYGESSGQQ